MWAKNPGVKEPSKISEYHVGFLSGLAGGVADTLLNYPPYGLHFRKQRGESLSLRNNRRIYGLKELYRGVGAYSFIIPVTCISDGLSTYLVNAYNVPSFYATLLSGMVAAVLVTTPTTNIIVQQQKRSLNGPTTMAHLIRCHGYKRFTNGMSLYMAREAVYANAVFWGKGAAQRNIYDNPFVASILTGILATLITQPMDTTATVMCDSDHRLSPLQAAQRMYREGGGLKRFYYGAFLRGYAIVAGIIVMSTVSEQVKLYVQSIE